MSQSLQIRYATEADARALGQINIDAFAGSPFFSNTFPGPSSDNLGAYKAITTLKFLTDPKMHVLAINEPGVTESQGYARWRLPPGIGWDRPVAPLSEEAASAIANDKRFAPPQMNEKVYAAFKRWLEELRNKHTTEDDLILDLLCTSPAHQGKGIGSAFMKWGLEKADAHKKRAYVEATKDGYPLYYKYGYRTIEEASIDLTPYGGTDSQTLTIMMREPQ